MKTNSNKTYIIAEAGVNHNGSIEMARELVEIAVNAGADAVKFQTFKAELVASFAAPKATYQMDTTDATESQLDMLKKLELTPCMHEELIALCAKKKITFLSTAFDLDSVDLLASTYGLPLMKIPSGEITNAPYLLKVAAKGLPIIVSTGMSSLDEIEQALGVIAFGYLDQKENPGVDKFAKAFKSAQGQALLRERVTLLHCNSAYPTPFADVNLRCMDTLREHFGLRVGFSDHTPGVIASVTAVARGAEVIEKHFTLDKNLPGPDHKASLDPTELKELVKQIRQVETCLGSAHKKPTPSEEQNRVVVRRSLVAACDIKAGDILSERNLAVKRPGTGLSPFLFWQIVGTKAGRDYKVGEII